MLLSLFGNVDLYKWFLFSFTTKNLSMIFISNFEKKKKKSSYTLDLDPQGWAVVMEEILEKEGGRMSDAKKR